MNLGTFLNFKFSLFAVLLQVFEARVERTYYTFTTGAQGCYIYCCIYVQYV